jgi:hypothetical protein
MFIALSRSSLKRFVASGFVKMSATLSSVEM